MGSKAGQVEERIAMVAVRYLLDLVLLARYADAPQLGQFMAMQAQVKPVDLRGDPVQVFQFLE
jgi:hypothetical protein